MSFFEAFARQRTENASDAAFLIASGDRCVPIDVSLNAGEIASRLEFVGAGALIYSALYSAKALCVRQMLPHLVYGGFGTRKTDAILDDARRELAQGGGSVWEGAAPDANRTATIVFTSGTTAKPHGAELSIASLEAFADSTTMALPMRRGERSLMVLPLHHVFGIAVAYTMLSRGVALGVCPDFRRLYDAVERFRANYLFLVPALADILAAKIEQHGESAFDALGCDLDWITVGGAPLHNRTRERLNRLGVRTVAGYGLTETAALYAMSPADDARHAGSAGLVSQLPQVETRVSERGELLIRGPGVMKGYFREPERTAEVIDAAGWLHTGDLGRIDGDGYVWITGRASRTIVLSSGKKVAPEELEERYSRLPCVREVLVTGDGASRTIRATVFSDEDERTVREAIASVNLTLPVHKRANEIEVRNSPLPHTSSGKLRLPRDK